MYPRLLAQRLHDLASRFPAVAILGARQVGKTTLARSVFPELMIVFPLTLTRAAGNTVLQYAMDAAW